MQKTTCGELGNTLPIGVPSNPQDPSSPRDKHFSFKPWTVKDERVVGGIRDKNRGMSHATFVAHVLAHFLEQWGPHDFTDMSTKNKLLYLTQSYSADILAAWVALRREAIGDDLLMEISCPVCRAKFKREFDLAETDATVAGEDEELTFPVGLRHGLKFKDQIHKTLTLEQLRWSVYEKLTKSRSLNTGAFKVAMLASSVVAVGSDPIRLPDSAFDEMTKYDLEVATTEINDRQLGVDLSLDTTCPDCGTEFQRSIEWVYDSFFSVSSSSHGGAQMT